MTNTLVVPPEMYQRVRGHVLPQDDEREQVAFLFAKPSPSGTERFDIIDDALIPSSGFGYQSEFHLELAGGTQGAMIKRAHELGASLVEVHSHRLDAPATFSPSDRAGLNEFVPHVWWRLRGRPYFAIVMGPSSFDALGWTFNPEAPETLSRLEVGSQLLRPTGLSENRWRMSDGIVEV